MRKAAKRLVAGMSNMERFREISRDEAQHEIQNTVDPRATATIFSQAQLAAFLEDFAQRLIERQAQWLVEDGEG